MSSRALLVWLAVAAHLALALPSAGMAGGTTVHEAPGVQTFASPQVNPIAVSASGAEVYVANTTSNTLQILTTAPFKSVRNVDVGLEPVSVALKPDGSEVWVSNHVSDSISVIDLTPGSASYRDVVETIQVLDANPLERLEHSTSIRYVMKNGRLYDAGTLDEVWPRQRTLPPQWFWNLGPPTGPDSTDLDLGGDSGRATTR